MTYAHAGAQEPLDAELNEWGQQRAQIEDERQELKRRGTPVDFMELNNRTCRWPLFEGHEPFYEKLYCGSRTTSGSPYCAAHADQACRAIGMWGAEISGGGRQSYDRVPSATWRGSGDLSSRAPEPAATAAVEPLKFGPPSLRVGRAAPPARSLPHEGGYLYLQNETHF
jgi:hypothetical protein